MAFFLAVVVTLGHISYTRISILSTLSNRAEKKEAKMIFPSPFPPIFPFRTIKHWLYLCENNRTDFHQRKSHNINLELGRGREGERADFLFVPIYKFHIYVMYKYTHRNLYLALQKFIFV